MNQSCLSTLRDVAIAQERELDELKTVLQKIVNLGPEAQNQSGDYYCFFCSALIEGREHEQDCPYILAKKLIGTE
jgi:hypothetical protein